MFFKVNFIQKVGFLKYKSGILHGYKMKIIKVCGKKIKQKKKIDKAKESRKKKDTLTKSRKLEEIKKWKSKGKKR